MNNSEKLIDSIKDIWKQYSTESYFESIGQSYFEREFESLQNKLFYSEISFYPNLITKLLEEHKSQKVEITFFSTMLPRHFFNFPVVKVAPLIPVEPKKSKYFDFQKKFDFLDKYRRTIASAIEGKHFVLKRVLFLNTSNEYDCYRGIRFYKKNDLTQDKNAFYCCDDNIIYWNRDIINVLINNKKPFNSNASSCCSSGLTMAELERFFKNVNEIDKLLKEEIMDSFDNSSCYFLAGNNNKCKANCGQINKLSIYDYYITKLHSMSNNSYEAYYCDINAIKGNKNISDKFKPDLGVVKIGSITLIINTFIDIINNITKLEIITEKDNSFSKLMNDISIIKRKEEKLHIHIDDSNKNFTIPVSKGYNNFSNNNNL